MSKEIKVTSTLTCDCCKEVDIESYAKTRAVVTIPKSGTMVTLNANIEVDSEYNPQDADVCKACLLYILRSAVGQLEKVL